MRLPILVLSCASVWAAVSTISNSAPRVDEDGNILEAGDGCVTYDFTTARYYLWGARYQPCAEPNNDCYCGSAGLDACSHAGYVAPGECCGWRNMTIAVYSSSDLMSWRKEGLDILPIMHDFTVPFNAANQGFMETCGVFNRRTGFWNLWFLNAAEPFYINTAVSRTVGGPYEIVAWNSGVAGSADLYLYFNVTADSLLLQYNGAGEVWVCTVKDDFLTVDACEVGSQKNPYGYIEGGGVFQHGGSTFVMAGHGCCFCTLGSNGYVWRSDNGPLGNYSFVGDIIPVSANGSAVTRAQQFGVSPIYTTQGAVPMYIGIRFGQAPDGHKNHDPQFWFPLSFDATSTPNTISWVDSFSLELAPPDAPAPVPPPPAAWFKCSLSSSGSCFEVPANMQGAYATVAECAAACTLCDLSGTWFGIPNSTGIAVQVRQTPLTRTTAAVTISCSAWPNATGTTNVGYVTVSGGWCSGGGSCTGTISPLENGGPPCAKIVWGAGTWCSPAVDFRCN